MAGAQPTVASGEIERSQLIVRLADAVQIDDPAAEVTVSELIAAGILETVAGSVVALSDSGRDRHARLRGVIEQAVAPVSADLPADDLAATRRVLNTISERVDAVIGGA